MPVYLDDAHLNQDLSDQIRKYASLLAVTELNIPAHLSGDPPTYQPTNPSPAIMVEYLQLFYNYQERLLTAMQAATSTQ